MKTKEKGRVFYVYIYRDPRKDNQPFYVGKGTNGRAWKHLASKARTHFIYTINKIRKEGLEPVVEIYKDNLLEEEAFKLEIELINKFGRKDLGKGNLCNKTDGGEGQSGLIHSEETKNKIRISNKTRIVSIETRRKMSESRMGHKTSEETRKKISEANKGKRKGCTATEETKRRIGEASKGRKRNPLSDEVKRKISEATKKGMTEEVRKKISKANKGKKIKRRSKCRLSI